MIQDELGVAVPLLNGEKHIPFLIHKDIHLDMMLLKEYLHSSLESSRLALFGDIQVHYVLQDEPKLKKMVIDAMIHMKLYDETNRLTKDC